MEIKYDVCYLEELIYKHIPSLPMKDKTLIKRAIEGQWLILLDLEDLCYSLKGHKRLRMSDYPIVYRIDSETKKVFIVAIKHRKDVYEDT